ncbi:MAG: hypothetical protein M1828_003394 [Chrysothrix sp. TS-e1954]|nr:MAG: hypothetical protein M1828_003394 [Chrysothrix sp. TS-e1954]
MANETVSLKECYADAESRRRRLDNAPDTNSIRYQDEIASTIVLYETCLARIDDVSLFSINEGLEDVTSNDLKYSENSSIPLVTNADGIRFLLIHFFIAELVQRNNVTNRKLSLLHARSEYESFLKLLDDYDAFLSDDLRKYQRYQEEPSVFSTLSTNEAAARRQEKITNFKEEKALKAKLQTLEANPGIMQNDDSVVRELYLTSIRLKVRQTFQALEHIAQELRIIAMVPPSPPPEPDLSNHDQRSRHLDAANSYSDRLDGSLSQMLTRGRGGPILSKEGRPLRPFTLLDHRQRLQQGVFRPDHNLPTMSIDEYLEEEKRRGGIIDGGGEQSTAAQGYDEDNIDEADRETIKARQWDEYVEANPKGSGNTMNMG